MNVSVVRACDDAELETCARTWRYLLLHSRNGCSETPVSLRPCTATAWRNNSRMHRTLPLHRTSDCSSARPSSCDMALPRGDDDYPRRWAWIKRSFTRKWLMAGGIENPVSDGRRRDGRRGVWLPKYWEHTIEDEDDYESHFDYVHFNPVKHGLVRSPRDWPWSSFHRWVRAGVYPSHWGSGIDGERPCFDDIADTVGE